MWEAPHPVPVYHMTVHVGWGRASFCLESHKKCWKPKLPSEESCTGSGPSPQRFVSPVLPVPGTGDLEKEGECDFRVAGSGLPPASPPWEMQ